MLSDYSPRNGLVVTWLYSRLRVHMVSNPCSALEFTSLGNRSYGHLEFPTDLCLAAAGFCAGTATTTCLEPSRRQDSRDLSLSRGTIPASRCRNHSHFRNLSASPGLRKFEFRFSNCQHFPPIGSLDCLRGDSPAKGRVVATIRPECQRVRPWSGSIGPRRGTTER
jgi:hypothetical protein